MIYFGSLHFGLVAVSPVKNWVMWSWLCLMDKTVAFLNSSSRTFKGTFQRLYSCISDVKHELENNYFSLKKKCIISWKFKIGNASKYETFWVPACHYK